MSFLSTTYHNDPRAIRAEYKIEIAMKVAPNCVVDKVVVEKRFIKPVEQQWHGENKQVGQRQAAHNDRQAVFANSRAAEHNYGERVEQDANADHHGCDS